MKFKDEQKLRKLMLEAQITAEKQWLQKKENEEEEKAWFLLLRRLEAVQEYLEWWDFIELCEQELKKAFNNNIDRLNADSLISGIPQLGCSQYVQDAINQSHYNISYSSMRM